MNPVYHFRIKVEPRINTTFNGQPTYITEYSIAFFTDREAIISINMQQDNIVKQPSSRYPKVRHEKFAKACGDECSFQM